MEADEAGAELEGRDERSRPVGEPAAERKADVAAKEDGRVEVMEVAEAGAQGRDERSTPAESRVLNSGLTSRMKTTKEFWRRRPPRGPQSAWMVAVAVRSWVVGDGLGEMDGESVGPEVIDEIEGGRSGGGCHRKRDIPMAVRVRLPSGA